MCETARILLDQSELLKCLRILLVTDRDGEAFLVSLPRCPKKQRGFGDGQERTDR
jgi:hypothetical protein